MNLKSLNIICYTICIVCIIAGVTFALILIWGSLDNEFAWKGFCSIGVIFLGSALTLAVNTALDRTPTSKE